MKRFFLFAIHALAVTLPLTAAIDTPNETPRIVNIINFIRQTEPRPLKISDEDLYRCTALQVKQLKQLNLRASFLLQYDALINPKYAALLKDETFPGTEIGAWWEITEPHAKAAGIKWRGRFPWDWHANVGFSTGYTPQERELLTDVYMKKFYEVFGKYPASVGSWFIDAHTLDYMYKKYNITASCNCKDQIGTDGYTLWGGYWNQAYYPSKKNAYMPAQNTSAQIPVPIFRMLGSDPIYQYDAGLGGRSQHVISLEPVYGAGGSRVGGGSKQWVDWFFKAMFDAPALGFNYAQAGQENSFTWEKMRIGLEYQLPILANLSKQKKIRVETLAESAAWFRRKYPTTPPTAFSVLEDYRNNGKKTVWFNSRFYRVNLLWHGEKFRFRDIHLFDENFASEYVNRAERKSTKCSFTTLPIVDGNIWSNGSVLSGLRIVSAQTGKEILLKEPLVKQQTPEILTVTCETADGDSFHFTFSEDFIEVASTKQTPQWILELTARKNAPLPFRKISAKKIEAIHRKFSYTLSCEKGNFVPAKNEPHRIFSIQPDSGKIRLNCRNGR
ncbi:MAG: hypothetical protein LBS59_01025 [Puniceicoccales bacterium]|jgi:hypothetical protein|nr:hypothetical protein [Puniceicoccales bacterium]